MSYFNSYVKKELQLAINKEEKFKLIVLWGTQGSGKTYITHATLNDCNININDIIFSSESFFPTGSFPFEDWRDSNEYNILMKCTKKFDDGECIIFQNMEKCELDYKHLIYRLLKYHKNANHPLLAILEYNVKNEPNDDICLLANHIIQVKENIETFNNYLKNHFNSNSKNNILFEKIIRISNENVETFFSVMTILEQLDIITKNEKGYYEYKNTDFNIPNNVLSLYINLLDKLDNHIKEPLLLSAPFSVCIYEKVIRAIFYEYDGFIDYLDVLCKDNSLLSYNIDTSCINVDLFRSSYIFSTEDARKAVLARLDHTTIRKKISDYYNYFDKIYNNQEIYNNLQDADKILLLSNLAKMRNNNFSLNQIKYIVDLMKFYYAHFMYLNAIEQGTKLIESKLLNPNQLNAEAHDFWLTYFNSSLAVGSYGNIIRYKDYFDNSDLNYCIALALYHNGSPLEALEILNIKVGDDKSNNGYKYSLMAAIYDWIGNNKKSSKYFGLALKNCSDNPALKYHLYKKYSLYVDFRILECQEKMKQAINYYKGCELKQYAECLHNYGTSCIFNFSFDDAKQKLELCVDVLNKVCSNEIYYPLNSMAILSCYYNMDYTQSINLWEQALRYDINIDFCEMALHNNMFNIYINTGRFDLAKQKKEHLEKMFLNRCTSLDSIKKEKPDIQHQLRQFFYNCGLMLKKQHCYAEALNAFVKAKECSSYHSVMLYSIHCYIEEIRRKLKKSNGLTLFNNIKNPTPFEKFIYDKQMYLCEIMFWG